MSDPCWTEAEIRAALADHWPIPDYDYDVYCRCGEWTSFDLDHIIDVLNKEKP